MNTKYILYLLIFFTNTASAQFIYEDTNQPDAVYRKNRVKTKTLKHKNDKIAIIYEYDSNGRFIAESHVLKDSILLSKKTLKYNSENKIITEETASYFKIDSSKKNVLSDSAFIYALSRLKTIISYDRNGELAKAETFDLNGQKITETYFIKDPPARMVNTYARGKEWHDSTVYIYDKHPYMKNVINYLVKENSIVKTAEETIVNYYYGDGSISRRTTELISGPMKNKKSDEEYKYNSNGLLIEKTEKRYYKGKIRSQKLEISYTYH